MAEKETENAVLEAHFAAARRGGAELPAGLAARMLADAAQVQAARAVPVAAPFAASGAARGGAGGVFRPLLRALGGWPAMGGLAAACAAGVWLGVAPPDFLPDPLGLVGQGGADVNLLDSYALSSVLMEDG